MIVDCVIEEPVGICLYLTEIKSEDIVKEEAKKERLAESKASVR